MKFTLVGLIGMITLVFTTELVLAHGFGGATGHPSEGAEAYHGGNPSTAHPPESSGAYHNEAATGAYHPPSETTGANTGTYHAGSEPYSATASEYHPQSMPGYPAAHTTQPTDAGFNPANASAAASGYSAKNGAQPTNTSLPNQGAAVRSAYNGAGTYNQNWYGAHPDAWHASAWATGDEWNAATWAGAASAVGLAAAAQPVSYSYGYTCAPPPGVQSNPVGQPAPAPIDPQSYQQSSAIAQSAPPSNPQSSDWTPLGVFALVHDPNSTPHYVMQLAVNKSGALAGNYVDLVTDTVKPVQGGVDKQSQRVAWTVGGNNSTVGEVGLYNLTQDQAPALLHMGPDKTQQWLLVRLKKSQ
ncbi:MAG TPA: hypothetical protein VMJ32_14250 [Pirellulales bacterium]|nr:hypothetical protein [Pirellulales bacterium]